MPVCEVCGNNYQDSFAVVMRGTHHVFDSFECAIHALAPHCAACDCRVIGHGVQHEERIYCSAQCARRAGVGGLVDHV
ncbi:MAG: hypothetical protein GXC76_01035 [Rhodanobacteraceae bacterium]|jgi:hypothetical protein|nr:hypothetical protein [Rhodanobacteraceae bacterium]